MTQSNTNTTLPSQTSKLALFSYLDLSTSHLTENDRDSLERLAETGKAGITISSYEYGFFVSVPEEDHVPENLPPSLIAILDVARNAGALIVRIDADGDEVDSLPTYEW